MTGSLPMTPGRWVALVVGTPLALLVIGWTALSAVAWAGLGSYQFNLAMPVAAVRRRSCSTHWPTLVVKYFSA